MSASLKKVEGFLKMNGYSFEMQVANKLQQKGFGLHQSVFYKDALTDTVLEIDLVAIYHFKKDNIDFNVVFPVECKHAKDPWVIFSSITQGFPQKYIRNGNGTKWMMHLEKQQFFENFFECKRHIGYGLTVAHTENKKESKEQAYNAVQSVLRFLKAELNQPRFAQAPDYTFYVPIIVINGELFETHLNEAGQTATSQIEEAQIFYKEDIKGVIPKIHVVTMNMLDEFLVRLKDDCDRLTIDPYYNISIHNPPLQDL